MALAENKRPSGGKSNGRKPSSARTGASRSGSGRPAQGTSSGKPARKKKNSRGRTVVMILLIVLIVLCAVFLIVVGKMVYDNVASPGKDRPQAVTSSYDTSPDPDKVSYYIIGLMGEEDTTSPTESLAILCWDRKAKTVNILEFPQDTYLGEDGTWAVKRLADVWANPKPLDWCEICGRQVFEPEITDGRHNLSTCNGEITQKTGSASENLINVFNDQYSLPVDGFFMVPQAAFVKLVDLVGGVDVELEAGQTLGDIEYAAGVQTLSGAAALDYITGREAGVDGDIARILKQRKVFAALMQRLLTSSEQDLTKEIIGPLMNGSTPIRVNMGMNTEGMVKILREMADVPMTAFTAYLLPGEAAASGETTCYSAHTAEVLALLNEAFNPYGTAVSETDLTFPQLAANAAGDTHKQALSEVLAQQSGTAATTSAAA